MSSHPPAPWRIARAAPSPASPAPVTVRGSFPSSSVAKVGLVVVGVSSAVGLVSYKIAGGGTVGFVVGLATTAVALPIVFVATGVWLAVNYGPGSKS